MFGDFVKNFVMSYGLKLIGCIVLLVVGFLLIKLLTRFLRSERVFKKTDTTVKRFIVSFITIGLKLILVLTAVIIIGVPAATVVALLGSCGLAIGLALQGGLGNLAGGVLILLLKPYKLGDYIVCSDGEGNVTDIGIFYTTLLTLDNIRVEIPNGSVAAGTIKNLTAEKIRRVDLDFAVSSGCELDAIRGILASVIEADAHALKEPAYDILISELTAASVTFRIRVWCGSGDYWTVYFDLIEAVKRAFVANGVEAPLQKMGIKNL
ncbi:MAG: mechanosensitive ion channel [Oscillospiraceae bacterium]|nr:mechanosensitive ion channel [Oscillospiraceae bacterium]